MERLLQIYMRFLKARPRYDSSADATTEFEKTASIGAETRQAYLENGEVIVLESKDKLRMTAGASNYFDIFVSILEVL
jgi:hypothetical protein